MSIERYLVCNQCKKYFETYGICDEKFKDFQDFIYLHDGHHCSNELKVVTDCEIFDIKDNGYEYFNTHKILCVMDKILCKKCGQDITDDIGNYEDNTIYFCSRECSLAY